MKRILVILMLIGIIPALNAQNPAWLIGKWQGVFEPNNNTSTFKPEVIIIVTNDQMEIELKYPDLVCEEKWIIETRELHRVTCKITLNNQYKSCAGADKLMISLMDNNYISVLFQKVYERFTESLGSVRLKLITEK